MKRIFKYEISGEDGYIELPVGAQILTVQTQHALPQIWALVDDEAGHERLPFRVYGTGHPADDANDMSYCGTFQLMGGALVFHLFVGKAQ